MASIPCQICGSLTDNDDRRCDRCRSNASSPQPANASPPEPASAPTASKTEAAAVIKRFLPVIIAADLIFVAIVIYLFVLKR